MKQWVLMIWVMLLLVQEAIAQNKPLINTVPLQQSIDIHIEGGDYRLLQCYNLYGFLYYDGVDSVLGEFIVKKELDSFVYKTNTAIKLCRVREFELLNMGKCMGMPIDMGIQLKFPDRKEMVFLNFDPEGPEPVFIPCK